MLAVAFSGLATMDRASAAPTPCEDALENTITLPRELKISAEAVAVLTNFPEERELLASLSRIFAVINQPETDLNELAEQLLEEPDTNGETALASSAFGALPLGDQQRLSAMLGEMPKIAHDLSFTHVLDDLKNQERAYTNNLDRTRRLVASQVYRTALRSLLSVERTRAFLKKMFGLLSLESSLSKYALDAGLDKLELALRKGSLNREEIFALSQFLNSSSFEVNNVGMDWQTPPIDISHDTYYTYHRTPMLEAVGLFYAKEIHVESRLDTVTSIYDYFLFGSPLPLPREALYTKIVDGAKQLLLPLKSRAQDELRKAQAASSKPTSSPVEPFRLVLTDHFIPRATAPLRIKEKPNQSGSASSTDHGAIALSAAANSLRGYTSFAETRSDLGSLQAELPYSFWFLREDEPELREVVMSTAVISWIQANPKTGRSLLNALHMGMARKFGQSGLKRLAHRPSQTDGTLYELKVADGVRGLLIHDDKTWRWLSVVNKDDVDLAIDGL